MNIDINTFWYINTFDNLWNQCHVWLCLNWGNEELFTKALEHSHPALMHLVKHKPDTTPFELSCSMSLLNTSQLLIASNPF